MDQQGNINKVTSVGAAQVAQQQQQQQQAHQQQAVHQTQPQQTVQQVGFSQQVWMEHWMSDLYYIRWLNLQVISGKVNIMLIWTLILCIVMLIWCGVQSLSLSLSSITMEAKVLCVGAWFDIMVSTGRLCNANWHYAMSLMFCIFMVLWSYIFPAKMFF